MAKKGMRFIIILALIFTTFSSKVFAATSGTDFEYYYYNQLDATEKEIYNNLIKCKESFLNGQSIVFIINYYGTGTPDYSYYENVVKRSVRAFTYDNPEATIWFENYEREFLRSSEHTYIVLKPKGSDKSNLDPQNIRPAISNFENICNDFVNSLSGTDEEKLRAIHSWLVSSCTYDYSLTRPNTATAYGTIVEKNSICSGFAHAYKYVADLADLDVLYVTGSLCNLKTGVSTPHAWNIAYIDNKYYLIDVTVDNTSSNNVSFTPIYNNTHFLNSEFFNYPNFS